MRSACSAARSPPMPGFRRTARRSRRRCCRAPDRVTINARPAFCRAARPTICSGSAATSSGPKQTPRLVRTLFNRMTENDPSGDIIAFASRPLIVAWDAAPERPAGDAAPPDRARRAPRTARRSARCPRSRARRVGTGSVIRDRLSPDAWLTLTRLASTCEAALPDGAPEATMAERVEAILRILSAFSGLEQENMTRLGGWRFLELGRRIERAVAVCRFIRQFGSKPSTAGSIPCSSCATAGSPIASATSWWRRGRR